MTADAGPGRRPGGAVSGEQLAADLRSLGLRRGQDLLIHCSLKEIGPVEGGPATVLDALLDVAGPEATLVVPAQTTLNSLTSRDFHAAVAGLDEDERARYVANMPGFDPARTPSQGMGVFAEHLRTRPSAVRSRHPQASFAALGPRARACMSVHDLDCHLGERSPVAWLYGADAAILLLGVKYDACTAFHLAEYRLPWRPAVQVYQCFTAGEGGRVKHEFTAPVPDDSDFTQLGAALEAMTSAVNRGRVGWGSGRMVPVRVAVDFGVGWLTDHRRHSRPSSPLSAYLSIFAAFAYHGPSTGGAVRGLEGWGMTDTSDMNSGYLAQTPVGVFTIEIATPGGSSADWRPFPAQELPLAEYARQIVERFDFKAEVIELTADHDPDTGRPGIIVIDPRFTTIPDGRAALEASVARLPEWILPMIVVDRPDDAQAQDLANQVRDILFAAGALRARSAPRGARSVSSFRAFSHLVRDLVFEAEKQYIACRSRQKYGPAVPSPPSSGQSGPPPPSRPAGPDRFASAQDRLGETPDAR